MSWSNIHFSIQKMKQKILYFFFFSIQKYKAMVKKFSNNLNGSILNINIFSSSLTS